jgi:hypothetical protein
MTIHDEFYVKLGRMTVAFGELDFMVAYLAANMAESLGEGEPQQFTARKLEGIKSWARKNEDLLGRELVHDLVRVAGDVKALLVQRQDAVHGLWLQEGDAATAWAMKLPKGATMGVPSKTDGATVDLLAQEARGLTRRLGEATVGILKLRSR